MNELDLNLPIATPLQLFVGTLGRALVWGGIGFFVLAFLQNLFLPNRRRLGTIAFVAGCGCILGAFVTLGSLFVRGQYEFDYVFRHSQASDPLGFKIAAIWGGQEGSFLLWATTSAIFGLLTIWGTGIYRRWFATIYSLFLGTICGILAYESPFNINIVHGHPYIPPTGLGLNESLQNYWITIHPPTIFLGFGSLTVLFAYAMSALITRKYQDWVKQVRPWALVSLSLVGVGLCMGGFWAYDMLGWGGFWKWDPVENVSFVPWCLTAAFIHGIIVQTTKGGAKWFWSNLLLGGLPFLMFVYGTFLTRAGFLDGASVHSFAEMEHTAHMVLLTFCITSFAGFLGLWGYRWYKDSRPEPTLLAAGPIAKAAKEQEASAGRLATHREGWYRYASILLCLTATATAIGMSVPLIQYVFHQRPKAVDEPVYHLILSWFFIPIMLMMAAAPFVSWRKLSAWKLLSRLFNIFSVTIGVLGVIMMIANNPRFGVHFIPGQTIAFPFNRVVPAMPWVMFLVGLCLFAALANVWRIVEMRRAQKSSLGSFIAHIGVATAMSGLIISRSLERSQAYLLQESEITAPLANTNEKGDLIRGDTLPITLGMRETSEEAVHQPGNHLRIEVNGEDGSYEAQPGYHLEPDGKGGETAMTTPDIHHYLTHDTYLAMGQRQEGASDPFTLALGQTKDVKVADFEDGVDQTYEFSYLNMARRGAAGRVGTSFVAELLVTPPSHTTKLSVNPSFQVGSGPQAADIDDEYCVAMNGMDAATKSANLQMYFIRPVYWASLSYKPMVILIWIGAGLMFLGGLMMAWYRRRPKLGPDPLREDFGAAAPEKKPAKPVGALGKGKG